MPSLAELRAKTAAKNTDSNQGQPESTITPENLMQIPAAAPLDLPVMMPQRGVFPTNMVLASDRSDNTRIFRSQNTRSAVFQNTPSSSVSPKTTTPAVTVEPVSPVSASLQILANNQLAPNQKTINFISSGALTITASPDGQLIFTVASGETDGLIHGDSIWEIDPAYEVFRDDFIFTNFAGTGVFQSEETWNCQAISGAKVISGPFPGTGNLGLTNNSVANSCNILVPGTVTNAASFQTTAWPLFDYPNWKLIWIFTIRRVVQGSVPATAFNFGQTSLYIGLAQHYQFSATQPRPPYFYGLRFDTDATSPAISDTTFHFECVSNNNASSRDNAQGNTFNTGVTPTENATYRLEMLYTIAGTIQFTLISNVGDNVTASVVVPKYSTPSGVEISSQDGLATFFLRGLNGGPAAGSVVTFAGLNSPTSVFDGAQTITDQITGSEQYAFPYPTSVADTISGSATAVGYAAVVPYIGFGNDSSASPIANTKGLWADFSSLAWNPGVGGGSGTPNKLKPRYF